MKRFTLGLMTLAVATTSLASPGETPVTAPGPLAPLRGLMLTPTKQSAPVVLIIPGSGPTDRDGNSPLGIKASTYKLLAQALAAKDVATVRIDKRGLFTSAEAVADANAVTIQEYAHDVRQWVGAIRQLTGAACVWVLGHSEGGLVALAAGASDPGTCGLILVAVPGRPMGQVLRDQLRANPTNAPLLDQAFATIDELEAGRRVSPRDIQPVLRPLFNPRIQDFLISTFALDPAVLIADSAKPALILQGERDVQVSAADAHRLSQAASARSRLALLPDTNHVLKRVTTDDRATNLATYADPDLPLAPRVAETIADFIAEAARQEGR
ncbi:MAG: alpha/beta fold hydrolase [Variovorax sp.]|nr:MAG: alpha/beta fold hydrolase [Variovorax sp.]